MAAKSATSTVMKLAKESDEELVRLLEQMNDEAAETEERCSVLAGSFDGKKTAILEEAKETKDKAPRCSRSTSMRIQTCWTASSS